MFNNISGKLKVWAIITVIIGNISAIISGVSLISQGEGFGIIGIVIMFAGILSSWLTAWILFGLGDLIDTTDAIYSKVNKNTYNIEHISKNVEIILDRTKEPNIDIIEDAVEVLQSDNGKIVCPKCGFEQDLNRKCCWKCGTMFSNSK